MDLDPSNPWLVDRWLRGLALRERLDVKTDYAAPIEDAPSEAREMLASPWDSKDGVIY